MSDQELSVTDKRGRGRPPKRHDERKPATVVVRLEQTTVDQVDRWIARQAEPRPTRAEAVDQLVNAGSAKRPKKGDVRLPLTALELQYHREMLIAAAEHFMSGRYAAATTLAGATQEAVGKAAEDPARTQVQNNLVDLGFTQDEVGIKLNEVKNFLKHGKAEGSAVPTPFEMQHAAIQNLALAVADFPDRTIGDDPSVRQFVLATMHLGPDIDP
jgi:hypothetical protein